MVRSILQLDPNGIYTYADYLLWEFEERVELLKGRIAQMAAPPRVHQGISFNLSRIIGNSLWKSPCKVYAAPFDVRLPYFSQKKNTEVSTVVQPDLCIICDPEKLDDKGCIGAPDLIIEILSPGNSRREMKEKFEIYQETGVKEYWIVSPIEKTVQVYVLNSEGKYIGLQPFVEGDILSSSSVPNLQVDLKDVFNI